MSEKTINDCEILNSYLLIMIEGRKWQFKNNNCEIHVFTLQPEVYTLSLIRKNITVIRSITRSFPTSEQGSEIDLPPAQNS